MTKFGLVGVGFQHVFSGDITFTTMGEPKKLRAGDMLYLAAGEPHALEAAEDSSFLLTIVAQSGEATT